MCDVNKNKGENNNKYMPHNARLRQLSIIGKTESATDRYGTCSGKVNRIRIRSTLNNMENEDNSANVTVVDMDISTDDDTVGGFSEDDSRNDPAEILATSIAWYKPWAIPVDWNRTVVPLPGTKIHPLDPRGRSKQPLHMRKDARLLAKKPLRMIIPRQILTTRIGKRADVTIDPREHAPAPTHTPSMERINSAEQMHVRSLAKTTPKDSVLGGLLSEMAKLHGTTDRDDSDVDMNTLPMSTPSSPTKPKGSINIPKKIAQTDAKNNPNTVRPNPPSKTIARRTQPQKFTASQHKKNHINKLKKLVSSPMIRCKNVKEQAKRPVGTRKVEPKRVLIKTGNPLDVIRDVDSDDDETLVDVRYLFGSSEDDDNNDDKKRRRETSGEPNKTTKSKKRVIYDSDSTETATTTRTAGTSTISASNNSSRTQSIEGNNNKVDKKMTKTITAQQKQYRVYKLCITAVQLSVRTYSLRHPLVLFAEEEQAQSTLNPAVEPIVITNQIYNQAEGNYDIAVKNPVVITLNHFILDIVIYTFDISNLVDINPDPITVVDPEPTTVSVNCKYLGIVIDVCIISSSYYISLFNLDNETGPSSVPTGNTSTDPVGQTATGSTGRSSSKTSKLSKVPLI